jgi:hypothetical protein
MIEIPTVLSWMAVVIIVFTLAPCINPALKLQKRKITPPCLTISRREKVITACCYEPLRAGGSDNNQYIFNDIVINCQHTLHLPDFTIPALFIAGVYFRKFWVVFTLILSSVAIDNYAIVHQGVSAHCITRVTIIKSSIMSTANRVLI